jgi:hypothetical protein
VQPSQQIVDYAMMFSEMIGQLLQCAPLRPPRADRAFDAGGVTAADDKQLGIDAISAPMPRVTTAEVI